MRLLLKHKRWLFPLLAVLLIAPFTPWLDLSLSHYFYDKGNDAASHFTTSPFIEFMYAYGYWIPNLFAASGVILLMFKKWRNSGLVILLTFIMGAGLVTSALLKEYWGRPRPKQVEEFGGTQNYRPFWKPQWHAPEPSKSFVSGHASTGFIFLTLVLIGLRKRSKEIVWAGVILTALFGGALSYARIAQGGHFFSDILFSALIMWWMALMMDWLVYAQEQQV